MFFTLCSIVKLLNSFQKHRIINMFGFLWAVSGRSKEAGWEEGCRRVGGAEGGMIIVVVQGEVATAKN